MMNSSNVSQETIRSRSAWLIAHESAAPLPDELRQALAAARVDAGINRLGVVQACGVVVLARDDFEANFGPLPEQGDHTC